MESDGRKRKRVRRVLLAPLRILNKGLDKLLSKTLGEEYYGDDVTQDDIISMVDAGNEYGSLNLEDDSAKMINNIFEFSDLDASDVMTHRKNIVGVEVGASLDDVVYIALDEGFSRIPVYKDTTDDIIGIIIVKDLLCLIGNKDADKLSIKDFLREAVYVPQSCSCSDVFRQLNTLKSGMAVVVDEYGGTAGIITLEDIIESIMGDIEDEYDEEHDLIRKRAEGVYEADGEADPEEVLELFGYELDDGHEYDTIAGFVTDLLGYIPEEEEKPPKVFYKDIVFTVTEVKDNCISKLIVRTAKEDEKPAQPKE